MRSIVFLFILSFLDAVSADQKIVEDVFTKNGRYDWAKVEISVERRDENLKEALYFLNALDLKSTAPKEHYDVIRAKLLETVSDKEKLRKLRDLEEDFITAVSCLRKDDNPVEITRAVGELLNAEHLKESKAALFVLYKFSMLKTSPDWLGLTNSQLDRLLIFARNKDEALSSMRLLAIDICLNLLDKNRDVESKNTHVDR